MKKIYLTALFSIIAVFSFAQGSCASPLSLGTPSSGGTCITQSNGTISNSGCAGGGYGGGSSWGVTYVSFCTNAAGDCINFIIADGTSGGNWTAFIYDAACSLVTADCLGSTGSGSSFNTSSSSLAASTCYVVRLASATPGTFTICATAMTPANDSCGGATPISSTPQSLDNFSIPS